MKTLVTALLLIMTTYMLTAQECPDCNVMICDGVNCDDGSSADGVQTSRNCSCGKEISGACAYVAVNLLANPYYNPLDTTCSLMLTTQENGNFNIYFLEENACGITDCSVPDFTVSSSAIFPIPQDPTLRMIVCKNGGNAGRRDFKFSITCSTIENCVNLIDDNGDSWVDCEDEMCTFDAYCEYSTTSSSTDGGLESNGRLGEKIAKRNFLRVKSNRPLPALSNQPVFIAPDRQALRQQKAMDIRMIIPEHPLTGATTHVSTPNDLIEITNATEVFSVDMYEAHNRVASILATESAGVYEHSKYICDRLHGAKIEKVVKQRIGKYDFLVTKFSRASGVVEYNVSFSFYLDEAGDAMIHSYWNLSEYPEHHQYFNYQIWANNLARLKTIVAQLILNLSGVTTIKNAQVGALPNVLIHSVAYDNKALRLELTHPEGLASAKVKGLYKSTETAFEMEMEEREVQLDEALTLDTEGVYAMGVTMYGEGLTNTDAVFFSDGAWGLDYQIGETFVHKFDIYTDGYFPVEGQDVRLIERNVHVKAVGSQAIAIYRPMNAAYLSEDVSPFNEFVFEASGADQLEVVFVLGKNTQWEDQPRQFISLSPKFQRYHINTDDFEQSLDDLKMIVFKTQAADVDITIENTHFRKIPNTEELPVDAMTVYPNPATAYTNIDFAGTNISEFRLLVAGMDGKIIRTQNERLQPGDTSYQLSTEELQAGLYTIQVVYGAGQKLSGRLLVQ